MNDATLFPGHRYAWIRFRGALRRYNCGRRFGHFRAADGPLCLRCDARLN